MNDFEFEEGLRRRDSDGESEENENTRDNFGFAEETIHRHSDDEIEVKSIRQNPAQSQSSQAPQREEKVSVKSRPKREAYLYQGEEAPYVSDTEENNGKKVSQNGTGKQPKNKYPEKYQEKYSDKHYNNKYQEKYPDKPQDKYQDKYTGKYDKRPKDDQYAPKKHITIQIVVKTMIIGEIMTIKEVTTTKKIIMENIRIILMKIIRVLVQNGKVIKMIE